MIIDELRYKIKDIVKGFKDSAENGVVAFSGNLDVRPPYQREFIYSEEKQKKVIDTLIKHRPINVFYWGTTNIAGRYELIDGQQRTLSICHFVSGKFSIDYNGNEVTFQGLPADIRENLLDYELTIYKCDGDDSEKLEWFETINIASEALTTQELRNAVYTGSWLSSAKVFFSKDNCPAVALGGDYTKGDYKRQELLEEALKWISNAEDTTIENYMSQHKNDMDAQPLWVYYQDVIRWVKSVFGEAERGSKQVSWGILYNKYHDKHYLDASGNILCIIDGNCSLHPKTELLKELDRLHGDEEVTSYSGVYDYIFSGNVKKLSTRKFKENIKLKKYKQQNGCCALCGKAFPLKDMAADHITPWSQGGKTVEGNCQVLCVACNSRKTDKKQLTDEECRCKNCSKIIKAGMFCQYCGMKN